MIVFQDRGGISPVPEPESPEAEEDVEGASVRQLEMELRTTKERLQTTTEELESSNEELKSSNEELSSMNEELQSANEELETSKEELQSINEELQTVNSELNARVEELGRTNNDMANLLEGTQIATIFLDRALRVTSFTPAAKDIFRLVESDAGRPLMHVRARFDLETLQEDAERVLRTLGAAEKPVSSRESDTRYMMRILPCRTADNVINGVVITFTDITRITVAEARIGMLTRDLRTRIDNLERLLDLVPVGVLIAEGGEDRPVVVNQYGARLLGATDGRKGLRPASMPFRLFVGEQELAEEDQPLRRAARTGEVAPSIEGRLETADGGTADVMMTATPLFDEREAVRGAIAAIVDISQHTQAVAHQRLLVDELNHRVKNMLAVVISLASQTLRRSRTLEEFSGAFMGRVRTMAATYALLSRESWSSVSLRDVVTEELKPYMGRDGANVVVNGPDVLVEPQRALALGMIVHELATNAVKYGALSVPEGRVGVTWRVEHEAEDPKLVLDWTEANGPPVEASNQQGFGMTLIERSTAHELSGHAEVEFAREGLRAKLVASLGRAPPVVQGRGAGPT
jgi:two-component system CheB/CheR fusion protein